MLGRSKYKVGPNKNDLVCLFLSHLDVTLFVFLGENCFCSNWPCYGRIGGEFTKVGIGGVRIFPLLTYNFSFY